MAGGQRRPLPYTAWEHTGQRCSGRRGALSLPRLHPVDLSRSLQLLKGLAGFHRRPGAAQTLDGRMKLLIVALLALM